MCKCCDKIQFLKEINKSPIPNVKRVLKATLTSFSKRKGERGYCGFVSYKNYDLNYCPQCGRKLGDDK